jgi:hypothetical protein
VCDDRARRRDDIPALLVGVASIVAPCAERLYVELQKVERDCPFDMWSAQLGLEQEESAGWSALKHGNVYVVESGRCCSALEFIKALEPTNMVESLR